MANSRGTCHVAISFFFSSLGLIFYVAYDRTRDRNIKSVEFNPALLFTIIVITTGELYANRKERVPPLSWKRKSQMACYETMQSTFGFSHLDRLRKFSLRLELLLERLTRDSCHNNFPYWIIGRFKRRTCQLGHTRLYNSLIHDAMQNDKARHVAII